MTPEQVGCVHEYLSHDESHCERCGMGSSSIVAVQRDHIRDLETQLAAAREAPTKIWNMGHNDDCIFCGLKDSVAAKFVPRPEAWQAENPTATPPSPEVTP